MLRHYGGSVKKALMDVYPDIGLEAQNFSMMPRMLKRKKYLLFTSLFFSLLYSLVFSLIFFNLLYSSLYSSLYSTLNRPKIEEAN